MKGLFTPSYSRTQAGGSSCTLSFKVVVGFSIQPVDREGKDRGFSKEGVCEPDLGLVHIIFPHLLWSYPSPSSQPYTDAMGLGM